MTQDLTPEAVAKMLEGVTPGPWEADHMSLFAGEKVVARFGDYAEYAGGRERPLHDYQANRDFIAWAREAVPALAAKLAEVEKLVEALREARSELESFIDAEWPEARRAEYPHVQAKWECDMGVCWRIDAAIAAWEADHE